MEFDTYFQRTAAPARPTERGGWLGFLTRTRGFGRVDTADVLTYSYLIIGTVIMFGPVLWLLMSSFKTVESLYQFPPTFLPYQQETIDVEGFDEPLALFIATYEDGSTERVAQVSRMGIMGRVIDPETPSMEPVEININNLEPVQSVRFTFENYTEGVRQFDFFRYLFNSVVITTTATLLTLLINSMAAYGLSKYKFAGRDVIFFVMIATLMVPVSVILIPAFLVISEVGWSNNLLGVIVPGAATPTGVFLLRQYMLTIPDELINSARIDGASEWRIYWQIVLPLSGPALAVLAIFSIMWRWNDFLWPLIVLQRSELYTLQLGLNNFQGELNTRWEYVIAMTVLTLLPITAIFAFLQRYITTGIATTGMK